MEQKKPITNIVAGLIIGLLIIASRLVLYFTGSDGGGWIPVAILFLGVIVFINLYGNARNNQVGFGDLFAYGFKTTAVVTLLTIVFTIIFLLAFPEVKQMAFDTARKRLEEKGNLTEQEIESGITFVQKTFWVFAIGGILLVNAIVGAIASLIGAAVTKKTPRNPTDQLSI